MHSSLMYYTLQSIIFAFFLFIVSDQFLFFSCVSLPFFARHLNILIVVILKAFSTNSYISHLWVH